MSKLTIQLLILGTIVVGSIICILYQIWILYPKVQHKKIKKKIDADWKQYLDSQGITSFMVIKKTDKLSPKKKMGKHKMR